MRGGSPSPCHPVLPDRLHWAGGVLGCDSQGSPLGCCAAWRVVTSGSGKGQAEIDSWAGKGGLPWMSLTCTIFAASISSSRHPSSTGRAELVARTEHIICAIDQGVHCTITPASQGTCRILFSRVHVAGMNMRCLWHRHSGSRSRDCNSHPSLCKNFRYFFEGLITSLLGFEVIMVGS